MCNSFGVYFQIFKTFGYKKLKNSDSKASPSPKLMLLIVLLLQFKYVKAGFLLMSKLVNLLVAQFR